MRRNDLAIDLRLRRVGRQQHDHVRLGARLIGGQHAQPLRLGLGPRLAAGVEAHAHIGAAVAQVERMGVPLAAEADDRDFLAVEEVEVCVFVVVDVSHDRVNSLDD